MVFRCFLSSGSFHFIRLVFLSASLSAYHLSAFANLSPAYVCLSLLLSFYFCFLWFRSHVSGSLGLWPYWDLDRGCLLSLIYRSASLKVVLLPVPRVWEPTHGSDNPRA